MDGMTTAFGEDPRPELQRDVQRLLGRCLLRLQQYERLLKLMLVQHETVGSVDTVEAQRLERAAKLSDKSMGTLVKSLFDTYAVPHGFERELLSREATPVDMPSMAISFRMEMGAADLGKARGAIEELVDLRNKLVHHLIEQFDVWTEQGCVDAIRHLEQSYERIDAHLLELAQWARGMDEARAIASQFLQSSTFLDMLLHGIAPDGTFEWVNTGIVRALRSAADKLNGGDWTRLDHARAHIAQLTPDEIPAKYGCRTWPQVLSESRQFDLQYRADSLTAKAAWYRERGRGHR